MSTIRMTSDNPNSIVLRWKECHDRESILAWHALSTWLSAEALMAGIDGDTKMCSVLWTLADLAHQRQLDIQPTREERLFP